MASKPPAFVSFCDPSHLLSHFHQALVSLYQLRRIHPRTDSQSLGLSPDAWKVLRTS